MIVCIMLDLNIIYTKKSSAFRVIKHTFIILKEHYFKIWQIVFATKCDHYIVHSSTKKGLSYVFERSLLSNQIYQIVLKCMSK